MTETDPKPIPWDEDALAVLESHAPEPTRSQLKGEIEALARRRGEDRVTLDTLLAIEDLLYGL